MEQSSNEVNPQHLDVVLGTAGHIDHGKTSLVKALTGVDTDRLAEERNRGISIELGFTSLELARRTVGLIDVPGHERFIRNMLAGASGIDAAILIVAADDGVMPQTREHLAILELLQLHHGVIVLTKIDLVDDDWCDLVEQDIRELTRGTFLADAKIIRTAAPKGTGIDELRASIDEMIEHIVPERRLDMFRMAIDRSFTLRGKGTIVTGTAWSGTVRKGDALTLLPSMHQVKVRGLHCHDQACQEAGAGKRVAMNLAGVNHQEVQRGAVVATPGFLKPSRVLTVALRVLPRSPWPLRHRSRVHVHTGTQQVFSGVRMLHGNEIQPGETQLVQLIGREPFVAAAMQPLVIRSESPIMTIGGGVIVQPCAHAIPRRHRADVLRYQDFSETDPVTRVGIAIDALGTSNWEDLDIVRDAAVPLADVQCHIDELIERGTLMAFDEDRVVHTIHKNTYTSMKDRISLAMQRLHEANPMTRFIDVEQLFRALSYEELPIVRVLLADGIRRTWLLGDERQIALKKWKPQVSDAERQQYERVVQAINDGAFMPPLLNALTATESCPEKQIRTVLRLAEQQGAIVHIAGPMYLHAHQVNRLRSVLAAAFTVKPSMTVSEIKDALSTSRKYAVPICEYLDRMKLTIRDGDQRRAGAGLTEHEHDGK